jgi:thiol:disulfide interchange protein DsbD
MSLSGSPIDYIAAFLGGLLLSFTPCVYPLIPISAGFIGVRSAGSRLKGLALSLTYVSGIAITYSLMGLLASLTGSLFGVISSHPLTNLAAGTIIIIFGLSMLDIFTLSLPNIARLPALKKGSYLSTFFLGLSSGLVIGPCLTPALGAILAYLATKKNIIYGMSLLFCFAYGMGFILILAGTFSSLLVNLPKADRWMVYIKRLAAFILLAMGAYFIYVAIRRL